MDGCTLGPLAIQGSGTCDREGSVGSSIRSTEYISMELPHLIFAMWYYLKRDNYIYYAEIHRNGYKGNEIADIWNKR